MEVKAAKPSWKPIPATPVKVVEAGADAQGNKLFQAAQNLTLNRTITPGFWIAALVLLLVYVVISFEWMHRTLVSFLGAALILFITYTLGTWDKSFYIISFDDAMGAIDLNVIFLLMGMMIFVGVMKKTGMFQFLAFKAYALAKGNVFVLSFVLQISDRGHFRLSGQRHHHAAGAAGDHRDRGDPEDQPPDPPGPRGLRL